MTNANKTPFELVGTPGGEMGTHIVIRRSGHCIAHLYEDAHDEQDWEDLKALIEGRPAEKVGGTVTITLRRDSDA